MYNIRKKGVDTLHHIGFNSLHHHSSYDHAGLNFNPDIWNTNAHLNTNTNMRIKRCVVKGSLLIRRLRRGSLCCLRTERASCFNISINVLVAAPQVFVATIAIIDSWNRYVYLISSSWPSKRRYKVHCGAGLLLAARWAKRRDACSYSESSYSHSSFKLHWAKLPSCSQATALHYIL